VRDNFFIICCFVATILASPFAHAEAKKINRAIPEPVPVIKGLRDMLLTLRPEQIGLPPSSAKPRVWGVLMEIGDPEGVATLVVLADGTTSLYLGHGGGVIGAGEHANVRRAAEAFLVKADAERPLLSPVQAFPLPEVGRVTFYFLTYSGVMAADALEDDLGYNRHRLSSLFHAGHAVITEVRKTSEKMK
jgi:hypothetical protein